jgi:salicylate hydroxylase
VHAGAHIRSGARVASVDVKSAIPAVVLENGERIEGDVIVGAGGFQSIARGVVLGGSPTGVPDPKYDAYK